MRRPIENNSSPGQAVYDPFCGHGTMIIAAEMTGRACHAIELNPPHGDVAIRRWQDFTGQEAILNGAGQSFDAIDNERYRSPVHSTEVPGLLLISRARCNSAR
jgi:hypothetical protein